MDPKVSMSDFTHIDEATSVWNVVYTKSRHESKVASGLLMRRIEAYLPQFKQERTWGTRRVTLDLPLFPNYVFCRIPDSARVGVLRTPGVISLVRGSSGLATISENEVDAIKTVLAAGTGLVVRDFLQPGERVLVVEGPLAGVEGEFVSTRAGNILVLNVTILQRSVAVQVDSRQVRPMSGLQHPVERSYARIVSSQ
jgi:transcription antitermination factor NusG